MRRYVIYSFMVLGILGCKDKPYVERVEAIKKHELSGAILNPVDQSVLSSNSFRDGVRIKATVASTVPLVDCRWLIESEHQIDGEVVSGQGVIEGGNCQIDEALDAANFSDGNYLLKIEAEDTASLRLNEVARSFQVFKEAPDLDVIWPGSEQFLAEDHIKIYGALKNAKDIKEIQRIAKITEFGSMPKKSLAFV